MQMAARQIRLCVVYGVLAWCGGLCHSVGCVLDPALIILFDLLAVTWTTC
jgi:hypothetical protein